MRAATSIFSSPRSASTAGSQHLCQINVRMWLTGHFWSSADIMSIYVTLGDFFLSPSKNVSENFPVRRKSFLKHLGYTFCCLISKKWLCWTCYKYMRCLKERNNHKCQWGGRYDISLSYTPVKKRHSHVKLKEKRKGKKKKFLVVKIQMQYTVQNSWIVFI